MYLIHDGKKNLDKKILNKSKEVKNDPFCFGFFIDNELYWNTPNLMANTIIPLVLMLSENKIYYITQDQV